MMGTWEKKNYSNDFKQQMSVVVLLWSSPRPENDNITNKIAAKCMIQNDTFDLCYSSTYHKETITCIRTIKNERRAGNIRNCDNMQDIIYYL